MYCIDCGKCLPEGAVFCPYCGSKITVKLEPCDPLVEECAPQPIPAPIPQPAKDPNLSKADKESSILEDAASLTGFALGKVKAEIKKGADDLRNELASRANGSKKFASSDKGVDDASPHTPNSSESVEILEEVEDEVPRPMAAPKNPEKAKRAATTPVGLAVGKVSSIWSGLGSKGRVVAAAIAILVVAALLVLPFSCGRDSERGGQSPSIAGPAIIEWSDYKLAAHIPSFEACEGAVLLDTASELSLALYGITEAMFSSYVDECRELGFSIVESDTAARFLASNEAGYMLLLEHSDEGMSVTVMEPVYAVLIKVDCRENLLFSRYDIIVKLDGKSLGTIEHGGAADYAVEIAPGNHILQVLKEGSSSVDGSTTFVAEPGLELRYEAHCTSDQVSLTAEEKIYPPKDASEYVGMSCDEAKSSLRAAGFTFISQISTDAEPSGPNAEFIVESVTINEIGDFTTESSFFPDAKVLISYHAVETATDEDSFDEEQDGGDETSKPLFYTTNTLGTVGNGNSGVYAYVKENKLYDLYWIVDFDEGYAYCFAHRDNQDWCDRAPIASGDLASTLTVTYYVGDPENEFSDRLRFKSSESPQTLVVIDPDGFEDVFQATDLNEALELRSSKRILNF